VPGSVASIRYNGIAATPINAATYAVTANFVPTDSNNYNTLTDQACGNFIINKATPTATLAVNNSPVIYNARGQAATVAITISSVPGSVSNILTGGAASQTNVGTYAVTASFVPSDSINYNTLTDQACGNFVIDKATPILSITNTPITYDRTAHAAALSCNVAGVISNILTGGAATQVNAGTYAVTASFAPTDTNNYNSLTSASAGDFVIDKCTLTVIGITAKNKAYDGTTSARIDTTNALLTGVIGPDIVNMDVTNAVGNFNSPGIADNKTVNISGIVIFGADVNNYKLPDPHARTEASIKLVLPPDPKPILRRKPPEPDSTSSNIANAANPNLVVNVQEYSWDEIYKKSRYVKGKYKTVVIVFEGKVIVSPYNDKGVDNSKGTFLTGGEKINTSGEIKNNKA
jgi:hypothetical protein